MKENTGAVHQSGSSSSNSSHQYIPTQQAQIEDDGIGLEDFSKLNLDECNEKEGRLHWVESFDLFYGSKKAHKIVKVEGDNLHFQLRKLENEERESRDYGTTNTIPNYVVANIGFVVTDRPHQKEGPHARKFLTFPIKYESQYISHVTTVYDFDEITGNGLKFERSSVFLTSLLRHSPTHTHNDINTYYKKGTNTFTQNYHHSERALWGALERPEMIQWIVSTLDNELFSYSQKEKGYKVYCVTLDLHSTRYLCAHCEPSSFAFQKRTGSFLKTLADALTEKQYKLPAMNNLTLFSRVSAEDKGGRAKTPYHASLLETQDIREIKKKRENIVLQRDDRETRASKKVMNQYGLFVSSKKTNIPLSQYVTRRNDCPILRIEMSSQNNRMRMSVTELVQQAHNLYTQCECQQALSLVKEAYEFEPENQWVLYWYDFLLKASNSSAFEILRIAKLWYECDQKNHTNNDLIYLNFISARVKAGDQLSQKLFSDESLENIRLALEADNTYYHFHYCYAHWFKQHGYLCEAIEAANKSLSLLCSEYRAENKDYYDCIVSNIHIWTEELSGSNNAICLRK
ncbi:MAG: hypothetical protein LEGION0403_FIIPPAGN_01806 [Legionella sp.]|uniref:hypothetical protein n=1 Tax=Legionella sp. TaxID=459 RepID=UPI003D1526C6